MEQKNTGSPRLQIVISEELDTKLKIYSAFLGDTKPNFARRVLTQKIKELEREVIPKEIIEKIQNKQDWKYGRIQNEEGV